jgi:hypothetical protein
MSDAPPRVVRLAYELGLTDKFEDFAAIELELVAIGLAS